MRAVQRPGRVEREREQVGGFLAGERCEGDACAGEQLARLHRPAVERRLGQLGPTFSRAQHEHDPPPVERALLRERPQVAGVVARCPPQPIRVRRGRLLDLFCLRGERHRLAADVDLHGLVEGVEEAGEGGDERRLLGRAAQLEAGCAGGEEAAVAAVCEFDQAAAQDAPEREVERRDPRLPRRAWKRGG